MSGERWLPVVGYEGYYEVSDQGRVRSVDRIVPHGLGGEMRLAGKILKPANGNRQIGFSREGRVKKARLRRLVLEAFVGPCPDYMEACHAVGSAREDSRLEVLRWDTHGESVRDRDGNCQLADAAIVAIREQRAGGRTVAALAEEYGRSRSAISLIARGDSYSRLGGPRVFGGDAGGGGGPLRVEPEIGGSK